MRSTTRKTVRQQETINSRNPEMLWQTNLEKPRSYLHKLNNKKFCACCPGHVFCPPKTSDHSYPSSMTNNSSWSLYPKRFQVPETHQIYSFSCKNLVFPFWNSQLLILYKYLYQISLTTRIVRCFKNTLIFTLPFSKNIFNEKSCHKSTMQ